MLPECVRNPQEIQVMNQDEELEYYEQNAKYHKRQTKEQQEMINRVKPNKNVSKMET